MMISNLYFEDCAVFSLNAAQMLFPALLMLSIKWDSFFVYFVWYSYKIIPRFRLAVTRLSHIFIVIRLANSFFFPFFLAKHIITYIALLYLQQDTILNLLTIQYIIVIIVIITIIIIIIIIITTIIIIIIIISNAFSVLQMSLTIHKKKPTYNTRHYITYLLNTIITYYDLNIMLLKELKYNVIT